MLYKKSNRRKLSAPKAFVRQDICVNVWDDYYDDGQVPAGEQQLTHAYIEEGEVESAQQLAFQYRACAYLTEQLRQLPAAVGVEIEYTGHRIWLRHLTHAARVQLVKQAQAAALSFEGYPFCIYSES